ncbi:hypothetical protein V2J09_016211 [Rumex salicifolius]
MAAEETTSKDASPKTLQAKNKVKFFCSYGGMILARPCDGHLKYVGGETRVISAHRNIFFSDLMSKINNMFEGEFVLKYQIGPEELDALVSVKTDEELGYMFDEYDRVERGGASKLRTYLFPAKPSLIESHTSTQTQSLEQRYVDALNSHHPFGSWTRRPTSSSRLKSVCSSPSECGSPSSLSPHSITHTSINGGDSSSNTTAFISSLHGKLNSMTRVQSSPTLFGLANHNAQPSNNHNHENNHLVYPAGYQQSHQHHPYQQQQHQSPWMSPARVPVISSHPPNIVPSLTQCHPFHKGGSGGHNRWAHLGQYSGFDLEMRM